MFAVIMAGGKGTRLNSITNDKIPKSMVPICGKPILQWQIENLKKEGISDIIIVVNHLKEQIISFFSDGKKFKVNIKYIEEKKPLGTAGALSLLKLKEDFVFLYGDLIFNININRMYNFHKKHHALITSFVHPSNHPFDSDLIILNDNEKIINIDSKHNKRNYWYNNCTNAGFYILNPEVYKYVSYRKTDFEKDLLTNLIKIKNIYGYKSSEYIKDAGTIDRIKQIEQDIVLGIPTARNLKNKQKAIFLDRDGTINKEKDLIFKSSQLELEPYAAEAVKKINQSEYLAIVITNQPVIAKGLCNIRTLSEIHNKLETLLGNNGAYINDLYYCPHHPDSGFKEENKKYKIQCNCRKPNIGMIQAAAEKYNIDLSQSWIVGDRTVDIQTGINAGLHTILLYTGVAGQDKKYNVIPEITANNLLEAVNIILEN